MTKLKRIDPRTEALECWENIISGRDGVSAATLEGFGITKESFLAEWVRNVYGISNL